MKDKLKLVWKIIQNLFVAAAIFVMLFFFLSMLLPKFSYGLIVIKTPSMEPVIKPGSMLIIKKQDTYEVDDVITFANKKRAIITHRIIEKSQVDGKDGEKVDQYKTKGDNNNDPDPRPAEQGRVMGKMIFKAPHLGYPIMWAKGNPLFWVVVIILLALTFIVPEALKIKNEMKKLKKVKENKEATEESTTETSGKEIDQG